MSHFSAKLCYVRIKINSVVGVEKAHWLIFLIVNFKLDCKYFAADNIDISSNKNFEFDIVEKRNLDNTYMSIIVMYF